jgi:hypothetical protein
MLFQVGQVVTEPAQLLGMPLQLTGVLVKPPPQIGHEVTAGRFW